VAAFLVSLR